MNSPAVPWSIDESALFAGKTWKIFVLPMECFLSSGKANGSAGMAGRAQKRFANAIPKPMVYAALVKYLLENSHVEEKKLGE